MPKVAINVYVGNDKQPTTLNLDFREVISLKELVRYAGTFTGLQLDNFDYSICQYNNICKKYVKVTETLSIQDMGKYELHLKNKFQRANTSALELSMLISGMLLDLITSLINLFSLFILILSANKQMAKVSVKINDSEFTNITVDVTFVKNIKQLSKLVIQSLKKLEENVTIEKLLVLDNDFNEYVNVLNSDKTRFKPHNKYQFHLSTCAENLSDLRSPIKTLNISHGGVITRQALGRIADIGDLYDAHDDVFCKQSAFKTNIKKYVTITDTERIATEYMVEASISEKLKTFEIEPELKASILSGMLEAGGHGKYLSYAKSSSKELNASLICRILTKYESLDISNTMVADAVNKIAIKSNSTATHIVTGIQWGAGAVANAAYKSENDEPYDVIKAKVTLALTALRFRFGNGGFNVENVENSVSSKDNFSFKFFADALPNGENLPQTMDDAVNFMKKLPNLIKCANGGKGVPIVYTLAPMSSLYSSCYDRIIQNVDTRLVEEVVIIFEELNDSYQKLNDIKQYFNKNSFCLDDSVFSTLVNKIHELHNLQDDIRSNLRNTLIQVRYGQKTISDINKIIKHYRRSDVTPEAIKIYCNQFASQYEKIEFAQILSKKGIIYIDKATHLGTVMCKKVKKDYYALFCDWRDEKMREENCNLFMQLPTNDGTHLIFVDTEVNPNERKREKVPEGNRICQFVNDCYIDFDVLNTQKNNFSKCIARCTGKFKSANVRPNKCIDLYFPCPHSLQGRNCNQEKHEWLCYICQKTLRYGFNGRFYCQCGSASMYEFVFRCSDRKHGVPFIKYDKSMLKKFADNLSSTKEINILLLGETGVGKSTFINGIANYLRYDTLEEAAQSPLFWLIPSQFNITDSNRKSKIIKIGESKNESFAKGESGTQEPLCHKFRVGDKVIRLIDTPGIGDTRGTAADEKNFEAILNYISYHKEIHGICILLKPNNSKMSIIFKYCINELLVHLHKSAAANIVFCFTHSRSTFYMPGETMQVLEKYMENMEDITIPLNPETTYCFDNEAFRFLCLLHNEEKFDEDVRKAYEKSWKISVEETSRLFKHFENDVKPHVTGETISLNEARQIILTAAKPLADITENIQKNIDLIKEQKKEVARHDEKELKLRGSLMVKHIGIEVIELGFPRTVCYSASCTETKKLPNSNVDQVIYKTICHFHCKLSDVTPQKAPNPKLQNCSAMNADLKCNECGCSWEMHMHITFEQQEVIKEYEDEIVKKCLSENKSAKETQELAIKSLEKLIQQYNSDQSDIDRILAKFASFLKKNAIMTYNDAIEDYLKMAIKQAQQQSDRLNNHAFIKQMENQLAKYQEEKRILDDRLTKGMVPAVQPKEIKQMLEKLQALPLVGKDIKILVDATKYGQQTNYIYREKHHAPYTPSNKFTHWGTSLFKSVKAIPHTPSLKTESEPKIWEDRFQHFRQ